MARNSWFWRPSWWYQQVRPHFSVNTLLKYCLPQWIMSFSFLFFKFFCLILCIALQGLAEPRYLQVKFFEVMVSVSRFSLLSGSLELDLLSCLDAKLLICVLEWTNGGRSKVLNTGSESFFVSGWLSQRPIVVAFYINFAFFLAWISSLIILPSRPEFVFRLERDWCHVICFGYFI